MAAILGERALLGPLTHADYSAWCRDQAVNHGQASPAWVQVRRQGAVLCGQVVSCHRMPGPSADRPVELFRVDTALGLGWFPPSNVRLCSGVDGRCSCEPLPARRADD